MDIKSVIKNICKNPKAFFLENTGIKQTLAKNTFWLSVAEVVTRTLKLILIIYVARILGATEYGKFSFALAFISLFAVLSDLGLSSITTRELSKSESRKDDFYSVLSLKLFLGFLVLNIVLAGSFFITKDYSIREVIWILSFYYVLSAFFGIFYAFFRAKQKMEYEAWIKILEAASVTLFGFFVIFKSPSVKNLSFAYLFATIFSFSVLLIFFHCKVYRLTLRFNLGVWKKFFSMSWPLALAGFFATIYGQIDSVMMGYWGQITQTGWYNAAYRIIGATLIPVNLLGASFFPMLSNLLKEPKEKLQRAWDYYLQLMIFLAVPLVIGGIILASEIIRFVYGTEYLASITAFQILMFTVGFSFLISPFYQIIVVFNHQKKFFWISLIGALVNFILNLIIIPKYSLYGAAFTTLVTFCLMFILSLRIVYRFIPITSLNIKLFQGFLASLISCIPMIFVLFLLKPFSLNVLISILLGAFVYIIFYIITLKVRSPREYFRK